MSFTRDLFNNFHHIENGIEFNDEQRERIRW